MIGWLLEIKQLDRVANWQSSTARYLILSLMINQLLDTNQQFITIINRYRSSQTIVNQLLTIVMIHSVVQTISWYQIWWNLCPRLKSFEIQSVLNQLIGANSNCCASGWIATGCVMVTSVSGSWQTRMAVPTLTYIDILKLWWYQML